MYGFLLVQAQESGGGEDGTESGTVTGVGNGLRHYPYLRLRYHRYRIEAALWLVYDKTPEPYQEFPKGIYLEQFDENLNVEASLKANYAHYHENEQVWTLRGDVHALNLEGEQFDTQELLWDQKTHRVYSDSAIHITREKSIIEGVGFESNEQMSKYTILHPTGIFPVDEE